MSKLFASARTKIAIALACVAVLLLGVLTLPAPRPATIAPSEERAAPLLEAEVQRRGQLRIFDEVQQLGPRLVRHSITIPAAAPVVPLPADVQPLRIARSQTAGHGLIVSAEGEILTSASALQGREAFVVELSDGREGIAEVVGFDPETDMVLLRCADVSPADAAPWATTSPTAGALAVAVWHARGQTAVAPVFVTGAPDADRRVQTTTTALAPGTPLFTAAGEVFAIVAGSADASAVLVAPTVARLRERIARGEVRRGALGLIFQPLDSALQPAFGSAGVLIANVVPYGPAEEAGVEPGDVLIAIGGVAVSAPETAQLAIAALRPQATVTLQLRRARQPLVLEAIVSSALTLRVRQLSRPHLTAPAPDARLVLDADRRRTAALPPGARILAIDGRRVETTDEARTILRRARPPTMLYVEDARGRYFYALEAPR